MRHLLIITDCVDIALNELYATVSTTLNELWDNNIVISPIANVKEFSIINWNFISRLLSESYNPKELTILAVVNSLDSSVDTRARIAIKLKNWIQLVWANTWIFSWLIDDFWISEVVETNNFWLNWKSFISFGWKYIHSPIAAKLAFYWDINKVKLRDFPLKKLVKITKKKWEIVHIDNFWNIKMLYSENEFKAEVWDEFKIYINNNFISNATYTNSMKEHEDWEIVIYKWSSFWLLELACVRKLNFSSYIWANIWDLVKILKKV